MIGADPAANLPGCAPSDRGSNLETNTVPRSKEICVLIASESQDELTGIAQTSEATAFRFVEVEPTHSEEIEQTFWCRICRL